MSDQTHVWAENYERDAGDVLRLQSDVAEAIAREVEVKLAPQARARLATVRQVDPEAYQAYRRGRYFWYKRTEEGLKKGIEYFSQAIQRDPKYAEAYVGLADSHALLALRGILPVKEEFPRADAAVKKALEIDNGLSEADATLAHLRLHEWDWAGLDEEFKHAIDLNPGNVFAYIWYSEYLSAMGRHEESISVAKKITPLDPVSPVAGVVLPEAYYFARQDGQGIDLLQKAVELDPNHFLPHFRLGEAYMQRAMHTESIEEMKKAVALSGRSTETLAGLAQAYASAGTTDPMKAILLELNQRSHKDYVSPYYMAKINAALKDKEQAFIWLERAYEERNPDLIELRAEPAFDPIRTDPRFTDLLRRVGWQS